VSSPVEADTIGELIKTAAATFGDAEAVVGSGMRLTFNQLDERSRALARRLLGRGVTKGTHVGVSFGNTPDFMLSMLAIARIGAIAVPISTFAPGRELLRLIRHGDLAAIVTTQSVVGVDQVVRLEGAIPGLAEAAGPVLTLPAAPNLRWIEFADAQAIVPPWGTSPDIDGPVGSVDDALLDAIEEDVVATDVALMIHTSGTTSDPKGVPHIHDSVCFRARYLADRMQHGPGERTCTSHVLFWIGGLTMSFFTNIAAGGTSIWVERFDAEQVLSVIETERVTRLVIYPHQVEQLLEHPSFQSADLSSLELADARLSPGADMARALTPEGHRMALGMSETFGPYSWGSGGTTAIGPIQDVQPGLEVRVVDEQNRPVDDGGVGEIVLRGRCVTPGYYKRPKSFAFDVDGWFHTGDRGQVDGECIHFQGRMTEMIKTSGANVAPAEVIDALLAISGIQEAYVLPRADPTRGELITAAVVADENAGLDAEIVRSELRKDLSPFKVPTSIAFFDSAEIPWTPTFKVRRHVLAEMIQDRSAQLGE
jgi:acyl-CoA synthetase (AMP-forming)/AMP-acid ligase II